MSGRTVAGTTAGALNPVRLLPTIEAFRAVRRLRRSRARHRPPWWRACFEPPVTALECPALFMHHPMVMPTQQRQVRQLRRPSIDPPDQVMSVAPAQRPVAAREDAMLVAGFQRPPRRRGDGPARLVELVIELAPARDVRDRRIAGIALHGRRRDGAAALEFAGRRPRAARQGVEAGPDD